jgi:tetratricopeptide (TPR) repeat protein
MMRRALAALMLSAVLALPVAGQGLPPGADPADPYAWLDSMPDMSQNFDATLVHLNDAIAQGRAAGFPNPDWGVLFAMLADLYRNDRGNAAYALRMAEEGLETMARWGPEGDEVRAVLNVSMAYSLADLGRYAEAVAAARAGLPFYRSAFGDDAAATLTSEIADWEKGLPVAANTSPLEEARAALVRAGEAVDRGEFGSALIFASRTVLPEGTGLDPAELRRLTAESALITGRALFSLGRLDEALEVMRRGTDAALDRGASTTAGHPVWRQEPGVGRRRIEALLFWYGRTAMELGLLDEAGWAYGMADAVTARPEDRLTLMLAQVRLMQLQGDEEGSVEVLRRGAEEARARGDELAARRAEFYMATSRLRSGATDETLAGLAAAIEAILPLLPGESSRWERAFHLATGAEMMVGYVGYNATALDFARRALDERAALLRESRDSEGGVDQLARETTDLVGIYLQAAAIEAARLPGAQCPDEGATGCTLIVSTP